MSTWCVWTMEVFMTYNRNLVCLGGQNSLHFPKWFLIMTFWAHSVNFFRKVTVVWIHYSSEGATFHQQQLDQTKILLCIRYLPSLIETWIIIPFSHEPWSLSNLSKCGNWKRFHVEKTMAEPSATVWKPHIRMILTGAAGPIILSVPTIHNKLVYLVLLSLSF